VIFYAFPEIFVDTVTAKCKPLREKINPRMIKIKNEKYNVDS